MRRVGWALSAIVLLGWAALVAFTIYASIKMEPGWSLTPAQIVLETIFAGVVLGVVWAVIVVVERFAHPRRESDS